MKSLLIVSMAICLSINNLKAQDLRPFDKTQNFISLGLTLPSLNAGKELKRALSLRNEELSYFENSLGERQNVGAYSSQIGWNMGLGFYHPLKKVNRLMIGSEFNMSLTGSESNNEGFSEAFYFNYMSFNFGVKYYPIVNQNLFLKLNGGFSGVMTKNRFKNEHNEQAFFHQFGIGTNGSASLGYTLPVKNMAFDFEMSYKLMRTRVEVNAIGNDIWQFNALDFKIGFVF